MASSSTNVSPIDGHLRQLTIYSVDTDSLTSSLLRWDAFHFAPVARTGYVYEYQWAFLPGVPVVSNLLAYAFKTVSGSAESISWVDVLRAGGLAALFCDSTHTLYHLTLQIIGSPSIAYLTALLSLLPSSPATLRYAGYSEPFFTYLSYKGMLHCAQRRWLAASCYFALAAAFRSNGIFLGGFVLWGIIIEPFLRGRRPRPVQILYAIVLTALIFAPFISYQFVAYRTFCTPDTPDGRPSWCESTIPSIYAYVQSRYWNNGFLRYWTPSQLPNILLASPVLALLFTYSLTYLTHFVSLITHRKPTSPASTHPFFRPSLAPHAIHALILASVYLFASHTQIALRQAASMPLIYWAAAWLVSERPWWGRLWVGWCVIWGALSIVLWTVFLPPA
ncbi:mannosyltransferase [Dentipellis sp. KUC8613]|nr:mannosyltransferase [Dentipellis sp. KUC8613]